MESQYLQNMLRCCETAKQWYDILKSEPRLNSVVVFAPYSYGHHCFTIRFSSPKGDIYGLSIACAPDTNRVPNLPMTIETIPIDKDEELLYDNDGNCELIWHDSPDELVDYILCLDAEC